MLAQPKENPKFDEKHKEEVEFDVTLLKVYAWQTKTQ